MPETRVADLVQELEGQLEGLRELLRTDLDFAVVEEAVTSSLGRVAGSVLAQVIEPVLTAALDLIPDGAPPVVVTPDLGYFENLEVATAQFGFAGVDAFVGYGGAFNADGSINTDGAFGLTVAGVDFGIATFAPTIYDIPGVSSFESQLQQVLPDVDVEIDAIAVRPS